MKPPKLYLSGRSQLVDPEALGLRKVFDFMKGEKLFSQEVRSINDATRNLFSLLQLFEDFDRAFIAGNIVIEDSFTGDNVTATTESYEHVMVGPCGKTIFEIKEQLLSICERRDQNFEAHAASLAPESPLLAQLNKIRVKVKKGPLGSDSE